MDRLKIWVSGGSNTIFIICLRRNLLILSWPCDVLVLRHIAILIISLGFDGFRKKC